MSWFLVARAFELTIFESPLVSRRSRSSPNPLPRIYKRKVSLEHEEEESFTDTCCQNSEVLLVKKTPRSNKIKQMRKQNTEDTQYKRDTNLHGSPSVGYIHQRNC
jgi:hypothetical protein